MLESITFNHFFIETKSFITERYLPFLNPNSQTFWKGDNVYYALTQGNGYIYVNMMAGKEANNINGLRELIKSLKQSNIPILKFGTFEGNTKILTFYKYIGAEFKNKIDNYYKDGTALLEYELHLPTAKRFKLLTMNVN